jgi:hypothetical protein
MSSPSPQPPAEADRLIELPPPELIMPPPEAPAVDDGWLLELAEQMIRHAREVRDRSMMIARAPRPIQRMRPS